MAAWIDSVCRSAYRTLDVVDEDMEAVHEPSSDLSLRSFIFLGGAEFICALFSRRYYVGSSVLHTPKGKVGMNNCSVPTTLRLLTGGFAIMLVCNEGIVRDVFGHVPTGACAAGLERCKWHSAVSKIAIFFHDAVSRALQHNVSRKHPLSRICEDIGRCAIDIPIELSILHRRR
jgi:hypothetical protein